MAIFDRGDIVLVSLDPSIGNEQQGFRPALVLSDRTFNQLGDVLVAPITQGGNFARFAGFAVTLNRHSAPLYQELAYIEPYDSPSSLSRLVCSKLQFNTIDCISPIKRTWIPVKNWNTQRAVGLSVELPV